MVHSISTCFISINGIDTKNKLLLHCVLLQHKNTAFKFYEDPTLLLQINALNPWKLLVSLKGKINFNFLPFSFLIALQEA